MFNHIMLGTNDLEKSRQFYDAFLAALGVPAGVANKNRYFWRGNGGTFSVSTPINGQPATHGNGSTTGFACTSTEQADAAHAAGIAAGGRRVTPHFWDVVMDGRGEPLLDHRHDPPGPQVFPPAVDYALIDLMRGVVARGTAKRAPELGRSLGELYTFVAHRLAHAGVFRDAAAAREAERAFAPIVEGFQHAHGLCNDFGTDAVTRQNCDFHVS